MCPPLCLLDQALPSQNDDRVHRQLTTPRIAIAPTPNSALVSIDTAIAPLRRVDVDVGWVVPLTLAGGAAAPVGTNVAEGSERQELAAALAAETEVGA
jgi:hypothetical protein